MTATDVFVGFGSNLGDPLQNFQNTKKLLSAVCEFADLQCSPLYWSEPLLKASSCEPKQDWYLNAVFCFKCDLPIHEIFVRLCAIEKQLGRTSGKGQWLPRTVDLDFLFYGDTVFADGTLQIPHPEIAKRRFVLQPLVDLAPQKVHPQLGQSLQTLLNECQDTLKLKHA